MEIIITMRAGIKGEVTKKKWSPTNTNITSMSKKSSHVLLFLPLHLWHVPVHLRERFCYYSLTNVNVHVLLKIYIKYIMYLHTTVLKNQQGKDPDNF